MSDIFIFAGSGTLALTGCAILILEAFAIILLRHHLDAPMKLLATVAAGFGLLAALYAFQTGSPSWVVAAWMASAGCAHILDMLARLATPKRRTMTYAGTSSGFNRQTDKFNAAATDTQAR
ncbi:hypothetical protein JM93_02641 [Roseibium hamelinense]|uniref:Uncharacterized protein n=1 Tax=Roseibium hamelinense TaxID=150831 RepID=A0A562SYF4_9HYPH|nr:hypothetical protein JM93_02641 [Roseibium hamelinense]